MKKASIYLLLFVFNIGYSQQWSDLSILRHIGPDPESNAFFNSGSQSSIELDGDWSKGHIGFRIPTGIFPLCIAPILNSTFSVGETFNPLINSGFNINANYRNYVSFTASVTSAFFGSDSLLKDYTHLERSNTLHFNPSFDQFDLRGSLQITPNKYFTITGGIDNYFLGNGDRSLLLDNKSSAYPFASLKTKIWRFELLNLYQFLKEEENAIEKNKYTSTHYLSTQLGRGFNISLFETVVFQPKDTLQNRGYEIEYLNPILFYRPTEYGLGSSDNVLLGLNVNWSRKKTMLYAQFIIDDLNIAEIRAKSNWWANKYGAQIGIKGQLEIKKHAFTYLSEVNTVRPFTYAHLNESQIYGHSEFPLAHPAGANFLESYSFIRTNLYKNLNLMLSYQHLIKGGLESTADISYGNNIYDPYTNRPNDFGFKTGENGTLVQQRFRLELSYNLPRLLESNLFCQAIVTHSNLGEVKETTPIIHFGIRSNFTRDHSFDY
ncbi:MAG: hypothetical protein ACPGU5_00815 [Lishizhenia sp.]